MVVGCVKLKEVAVAAAAVVVVVMCFACARNGWLVMSKGK